MVDLDKGVQRMAAWAKRIGSRASGDFEDIEVTRKLPSSWARG